jgi:hypothetical protein
MTMLKMVYKIKIVITIIFWAVPLTFFPPQVYDFFGIPIESTYLFIRLLGTAYFALLFGYFEALHQIKNNIVSIRIPLMSITANGGASIVILIFLIMGSLDTWGLLGKVYIIVSCIILFMIASLLTISLIIRKKE